MRVLIACSVLFALPAGASSEPGQSAEEIVAVSGDHVVGPSRHIQWISGPRFSRSHDHLASVSAMVSAGGRLFSIVNMGSSAFAAARPRWRLAARDAFSGVRLWNCPAYEGFNAPVDVMITDGLLWTGRYAWGNDPGITHAPDPKTGEVRRQRPADQETVPRMGHARCHRAKATARYLILGRRGVEFVDLETGRMTANFWVRGVCQYGVMPANGLLYVPPHPCACNYSDMVKSGFMALAPEREAEAVAPADSTALERGPAYQWQPPDRAPDPRDWPTHRGNASRSGATAEEVDRARRDAGVASGGHLPDILASDGRSLFLRSARFNLELQRQKDDATHLFSPVGFLDDTCPTLLFLERHLQSFRPGLAVKEVGPTHVTAVHVANKPNITGGNMRFCGESGCTPRFG